jgi:hypothetical protein
LAFRLVDGCGFAANGCGCVIAEEDVEGRVAAIVFRDGEFAGGLEPLAGIAKVAVSVDGADRGFKIQRSGSTAIEDVVECAAEVAGAGGVKTGGAGVAIEERAVANVVFADNVDGMPPVDKIEIDLISLRMMADDASARVAAEVRGGSGVVRSAFVFGGHVVHLFHG